MSNTRRDLLIGGAALLLAPAVRAEAGFAIDWQGAPEEPEVARSLADQIATVTALPISAEAMAFFRSQTITVDREADTKTRAGPRGIFFARRAQPADNPVLIHELIHRYQLLRMPGGQRNRDVHRFYDAARAKRAYPLNAYLMTNAFEFFAMTASTVLHGRADRPPFRRDNVRARSPELYAFIVREFGFTG